jgi:hypothetical protein
LWTLADCCALHKFDVRRFRMNFLFSNLFLFLCLFYFDRDKRDKKEIEKGSEIEVSNSSNNNLRWSGSLLCVARGMLYCNCVLEESPTKNDIVLQIGRDGTTPREKQITR